MNIQEIRKEKQDTETRIREFIMHEKNQFEKVTGFNITGISVSTVTNRFMGDNQPRLNIDSVKFSIEL